MVSKYIRGCFLCPIKKISFEFDVIVHRQRCQNESSLWYSAEISRQLSSRHEPMYHHINIFLNIKMYIFYVL